MLQALLEADTAGEAPGYVPEVINALAPLLTSHHGKVLPRFHVLCGLHLINETPDLDVFEEKFKDRDSEKEETGNFYPGPIFRPSDLNQLLRFFNNSG